MSEATLKPHRPSLFAITVAHSSVDMQTAALPLLLPILLSSLSLNYKTAAAIVTANQIVIAIAQPLFGAYGDHKPVKAMVWLGCILTALGMAGVLFLPNYWSIVAAVIISGIGSAMFHPEALSRARAVMRDKPATGVSVFFSGGNVGFALGPILITLLVEHFGKPGALLMLVPTAIGLIGLASQWPVIANSRGNTKKSSSADQPNNWGLVAFLIVLIAVRGTASVGLATFIPLYYRELGTLPPNQAALLVTMLALSGAIGTLMGGSLADKYGRRLVMGASLVVALAALYAFLHTGGLLQLACISVAGASLSAAWPIIVVMIQEAMPSNLGLAGGISLGTTYAASGLGVAALGVFADWQGVVATMTVLTLLPLISLALTAFVPEKARAPKPATAAT